MLCSFGFLVLSTLFGNLFDDVCALHTSAEWEFAFKILEDPRHSLYVMMIFSNVAHTPELDHFSPLYSPESTSTKFRLGQYLVRVLVSKDLTAAELQGSFADSHCFIAVFFLPLLMYPDQ